MVFIENIPSEVSNKQIFNEKKNQKLRTTQTFEKKKNWNYEWLRSPNVQKDYYLQIEKP